MILRIVLRIDEKIDEEERIKSVNVSNLKLDFEQKIFFLRYGKSLRTKLSRLFNQLSSFISSPSISLFSLLCF